jgi:hypothetical protein
MIRRANHPGRGHLPDVLRRLRSSYPHRSTIMEDKEDWSLPTREPSTNHHQGRRGPLNSSELEAFLALPLLARLACVDASGWPYSVPVWFQWERERFWIIGSERATWVQLVQAQPRVALLVDDPVTRTRVLCQGEVRRVDHDPTAENWIEVGRRMSMRYLPGGAEGYVESLGDFPGRLFEITPRKLMSWQGPSKQHQ